jgi:methylglutaconyl-CoA hydratase
MVDITKDNTVLILRFDRPDKKNALTPGMIRSLTSELSTAHSARAIVISGTGPVFCSGFDLSACRDDVTSAVLAELLTLLAGACTMVRRAICPVIVSAHGAALAGGCALAAAADFMFTHADAKLGYPVVKLGISPAVSAPMLMLSAGPAARALLLDSGLISGTRALELGFAHRCEADAPACEAAAIAFAHHLAAKAPHALAHTKRWLNTIDGSLNDSGTRALEASLSRVGTGEERELLGAVWRK